jgi:hypothetical protein
LNPLNPPRALFQTTEELIAFCEVMVWAFVVCVVMLVFGGLVATMLYSVTFVAQPMKTMAPIDLAYTKMLNDIVLLMTGSITTLIGMRVAKKASEMIADKVGSKLVATPAPTPPAPTPTPTAPAPAPTPAASADNWLGWVNPPMDEDWRPPPPPTTPPDFVDPAKEDIAIGRELAKREGA